MKDKDKDSSQYMTVKTVYARAAMLLLAANFCLTGYCFLNLSNAQQEQIDGIQGGSSSMTTTEARTLSRKSQSQPASSTTETRENQ